MVLCRNRADAKIKLASGFQFYFKQKWHRWCLKSSFLLWMDPKITKFYLATSVLPTLSFSIAKNLKSWKIWNISNSRLLFKGATQLKSGFSWIFFKHWLLDNYLPFLKMLAPLMLKEAISRLCWVYFLSSVLTERQGPLFRRAACISSLQRRPPPLPCMAFLKAATAVFL